MNIGERIKTIRLEKGMTQKELSKMVGIATNSLSRYETGEREPSVEMLEKIAHALNIGVENFFISENASILQKENVRQALEYLEFTEAEMEIIKEADRKLSIKQFQMQRELIFNIFDNILNESGRENLYDYATKLSKQDEYIRSSEDKCVNVDDLIEIEEYIKPNKIDN